MIQRIQSIFLLAAAILQLVLVTTPLAHFFLNDLGMIDFYSKGFMEKSNTSSLIISTVALNALCWVILILSIVTIFLFKKRILQMRMSIYALLLDIGLIVMLALQIYQFKTANLVTTVSYTLSIVIPLVNAILHYLAFRGIRKDELLVKAYDRLR